MRNLMNLRSWRSHRMDIFDIAGIRTKLHQPAGTPAKQHCLKRFHECSADARTRDYFRLYGNALIFHLSRKNCEAIALQAGVPVRSVQWFLSGQNWDHERMRNILQKIVARKHAGKHSVGIFDETSFVKKGDKTPGVQRQHCGTVGKQENCIVTVHLAYAQDNFHTLID